MLLTDARTEATKLRIQAAVEAGLKSRKVSARRASLDVVGNDGLVRDIRAGVMPAVDRLEALMGYLGLGFHFGAPGDQRRIEHVVVEGSDYARIPLHEAALSAGPGTLNGDTSVIDHLAFSQDWLGKVGISRHTATMARISGDSMAPGLCDGDLVMIDTSKQEVPIRGRQRSDQRRSPVYAFVQAGEARVKRIERPEPKLLILLSDNPSFPPEVLTSSSSSAINILGQVVWSGHIWR